MRKNLLLLVSMLAMSAWTGVMAQDASDAEYLAALEAITDGAVYHIKTDVEGTDYYVTYAGTLTSNKDDAGYFVITKTEGGYFGTGFRISSETERFTNPTLVSNVANLQPGNFAHSTNDRADWERQILYQNEEGKYAIRSCNCADGTESWNDAARTHWTYYMVGDVVTPCYSYEKAYIWEFELMFDADGAQKQQDAYNVIQTWIPTIQRAKGLVKDGAYYSSNAKDPNEGSYAALLDDVYTTFFHSSYHSGQYDPQADHYLQAELSEPTQNFRFYYKKRSHNNNNRPTTIVISASNDGENFVEVQSIKSGLPTDESVIDYISNIIDLGAAYKYVRFTITETNNGQKNGDHVFFTFSEFYILPEIAALDEAISIFQERKTVYQLDADHVNEVDATLRAALNTVNVTYELYEDDGVTLVKSTAIVQEAGSDLNIPADFMNLKYYDYEINGTIGNEDCAITIIRSYKPGLVLSFSDLSNEKSYYIHCDRGSFLAAYLTEGVTSEGYYMISNALDAAADKEPSKFAIIDFDGAYYLYSVDYDKFVTSSGALKDNFFGEKDGSECGIIMEEKAEPYFLWRFNKDASFINTNSNPPLGYVINSYSTPDPGNQYFMIEADDFDPTTALETLENYFYPSYTVNYIVKDEQGNDLWESGPMPTSEGATITTLPDDYHRPFYTYDELNLTITELETDAVFTATWTGPFKISEDYFSAHWYDLAMRGTWYVTTEAIDGDGAYQTQNANTLGLVEDSYQWAFIGNGYDGFKIVNKLEGNGMSLGWTDANQVDKGIPTVMDDNSGYHIWNIVPSTNTTVPAGSFCLNVPGTTLYINQYGGVGGSVKFWNSANNLGDSGSAFTVFDVPTNFASYVVSDIAPALEAKGYFTFTDDAKADIGYDESMKTDCSYEDYKDMKENLEYAMYDLGNFILPETGFYILKNKYYSTYMGIDPSDSNMYGNYNHAKECKHIVKLTKIDDGVYTIGLMGKFAPNVVEQSQPVKGKGEEEAGEYTLVIPVVGYGVFQADPSVEMSCLHCRAAGDLVGWEPNSPASQWEVIDAASVELSIGSEGYDTAFLPFDVKKANDETPDPIGVWTFDDNTTNGEGEATLTASEGVTFENGQATVPAADNLQMATNLETTVLPNYTVMMDVKISADFESDESLSNFTALIQNTLDQSKDASIFAKFDKNTKKRGIGLGSYGGEIALDTWYRIVVVNEDNIPSIYVDGLKVIEFGNANANNWQLTTGAIFFQDNDGEENDVVCDELRFWDVPLSASQVAELGTYGGGAAIAIKVPEAAGTWTFDDADNLLAGTGTATLESATHTKGTVTIADIASTGIVTTEGPANGNGAVTVPVGASFVMTPAETGLTSYTLMMDIKSDDTSSYSVLYTNKENNEADGSFFIKDGAVGLNTGGLGYHGTINQGQWHRVVFVVDNLYAKVFIDGARVGESTQQVAQHWTLNGRALFFADDDVDEKVISTSEIRFWNEALSVPQVEKLGTAGFNPADEEEEDGIKVYTGKVKDSYIVMTELTGGIPAKTGVVLKGKPGTYKFDLTEDLVPVTDNDLKGTLEPIQAEGLYLLNKPAGDYASFIKATSGMIAAGKAYLDVQESTIARYPCLFDDDDPDAIKGVDNAMPNVASEDNFIYNIVGQRLNKMQKGVNIMNGKKVMVK